MSQASRPSGERPARYSRALGRRICRRIVEGESLTAICAGADMPAKSTVLMWAATLPEFAELYGHARELAADAHADEVAHLARLAGSGELNPTAARAAMDGLKWAATQRGSRRGGDAGPARADLSRLSDEELEVYERLVGKLVAGDLSAEPGGDPGGADAPEGAEEPGAAD